MKIIIPGGTGQLGGLLERALIAQGHEVILVSRSGHGKGRMSWDGVNLGPWATEIDGADVVINLAGRTVNCRNTDENMKEMLRSRVDSTRVVGQAIANAKRPPRLWLQMSTATIYAHRFDAANDEASGVIGGNESDVPAYWAFSVDLAKAWEQALNEAPTPQTRKVALRTSMVMSPDKGGVFDVLLKMTRFGLGGAIGGGAQYVSWIHDDDFVRAMDHLIARDDIDGPVNMASPGPIPQRDFMATLRDAWGAGVGLPATKWMAEIGAFFLRTDTELLLKSRRVVPGRLLENGFSFGFPDWSLAARDLVERWRAAKGEGVRKTV